MSGDRRETAVPDDPHAVADAFDLGHHVGAQEDRGATLALLLDHGEERLLHERIQTLRGFVQDQEVGPVHERLDQADLLLVAV